VAEIAGRACLFYAGTPGQETQGRLSRHVLDLLFYAGTANARNSRRRDNGVGINVKTLLLVVLTCQIHANDIKIMCIA